MNKCQGKQGVHPTTDSTASGSWKMLPQVTSLQDPICSPKLLTNQCDIVACQLPGMGLERPQKARCVDDSTSLKAVSWCPSHLACAVPVRYKALHWSRQCCCGFCGRMNRTLFRRMDRQVIQQDPAQARICWFLVGLLFFSRNPS